MTSVAHARTMLCSICVSFSCPAGIAGPEETPYWRNDPGESSVGCTESESCAEERVRSVFVDEYDKYNDTQGKLYSFVHRADGTHFEDVTGEP